MKSDNELIAEFMGFKATKAHWGDGTVYSHPDMMGVYGEKEAIKFKYDTSWDWLMPVVEKIESKLKIRVVFKSGAIGNEIFYIQSNGVRIDGVNRPMIKHATENKLQDCYNCCLDFIKWYNQQSKVKP